MWEQSKNKGYERTVLKLSYMPFDREISKTKFGNIASITRHCILKDRGIRSRILYAGKL